VVRGRLWRCANPALKPADHERLVHGLMDARREIGMARRRGDSAREATSRKRVHATKVALGERGPVWWSDGAPDYNRRLVKNSPYARWYERSCPPMPDEDANITASYEEIAMNIFDALREDHDKQRALAGKLVETHGASDEREALFAKLSRELKNHAAAEERHFYAPLMQHDLTQDRARHSVAEHHDIDELIEKLEDTEQTSPQWLAIAKQLQAQVTHHLDEEEQEVFQMAGKRSPPSKRAHWRKIIGVRWTGMTSACVLATAPAAGEYSTDEHCLILELLNSQDDRHVSVARARVEPGVTTKRHCVIDTEERYVILQGAGRMLIDEAPARRVGPGDTVRIAAGVGQSIANTGDSDLVFLCICTPRFEWRNYRSLE